ncbi:hypothetical protein NJBCHELONAE_28060 [Mycobacteroides chelonae]|nr:hypothetical protein NJBCHELONAE_28060 [Mycobacteroides chelonae]
MDQSGANLATRLGHPGRTFGIDRVRPGLIAFRGIHGGVRGAVDHGVPCSNHTVGHAVAGNIPISRVQGTDREGAKRGTGNQMGAELTARSGDNKHTESLARRLRFRGMRATPT